jgi:hypothetical protein
MITTIERSAADLAQAYLVALQAKDKAMTAASPSPKGWA